MKILAEESYQPLPVHAHGTTCTLHMVRWQNHARNPPDSPLLFQGRWGKVSGKVAVGTLIDSKIIANVINLLCVFR